MMPSSTAASGRVMALHAVGSDAPPGILQSTTGPWGHPLISRNTVYTHNLGENLALCQSMKVKVAQSCPTLCNPMDYTIHGILQARILEWVAGPFSRGSSQPRDRTQVFHIASGFFTSWATRKPYYLSNNLSQRLRGKLGERYYHR